MGSILRRLHRCFQKREVNCVPQSDTIVLGSPCRFQMNCRYSLATSSELAVVWHGSRCRILVSLSTITRIASNPLLSGSPVTKSIDRSCHGCLGIVSGRSTPWGE